MTPIAEDLLYKRYLKRDETGKVIEDSKGMFRRVAANIARAEIRYGGDSKLVEKQFFSCLKNLDFVPASPILMHAGNTLQYLFSDHALEVPDNMEQIFEVLKIAATIQQHGGGLGFSFSKIRPAKDDVSGMKNVAFGPISVMHIFDTSFNAILQGGRRSGANMAVLDVNHPDILSFINAKRHLGKLSNFNLSVAITDQFMQAVKTNGDIPLINPRNNAVVKSVKAKMIFDEIVDAAWSTGDPGVIFIDEMNRKYPFKKGNVLCTGSCGQYELESYEGVPYAHLNLVKMLDSKDGAYFINDEKIKSTVHIMVNFLDNCIDMHQFTHKIVEQRTKKVRKIGLGVMGFADMLFKLKVSYGSTRSIGIIKRIMKIIQDESRLASHVLAKKRGAFPLYPDAKWSRPVRNATITSIAPTGSTSIIAGTSQSIEPVFALSYSNKTSSGEEFTLLNETFKQVIDSLSIERTAKIQLQFVDSIQNIPWLEQSLKKIFKTAMDVPPDDHLAVMAAFQEYVDNSISKTINLPRDSSQEQVARVFIHAYDLKCKGVTIYRDGCREDQVLTSKTQTRLKAFDEKDSL